MIRVYMPHIAKKFQLKSSIHVNLYIVQSEQMTSHFKGQITKPNSNNVQPILDGNINSNSNDIGNQDASLS